MTAEAAQDDKSSRPENALLSKSTEDLADEIAEVTLEASPDEEELEAYNASQQHKAAATDLFAARNYTAAVTAYANALAVCPPRLAFATAVLHSNMAACHVLLSQWEAAMAAATAALNILDEDERGEEKTGSSEENADKNTDKFSNKNDDEEKADASGVSESMPNVNLSTASDSDPTKDSAEEVYEEDKAEPGEKDPKTNPLLPPQNDTPRERQRIRIKALLRRARARSEAGGWQNLSGAQEDYKQVLTLAVEPPTQTATSQLKTAVQTTQTSSPSTEPKLPVLLSASDRRFVQSQLQQLPPRVKQAQEREVGEMWGKLKDLGNGILKPFGLSTNNFQMVQDPKTGGYSMNFTS